MKEIEFTLELPQNPKGTAQQIRHTQHGHYIPRLLRQTMAMYMEALKDKGDELWTGPLSVRIEFYYSTKDKKKHGTWKTSMPDCDNIVKPLLDCMTRTGFWMDDSQIVDLHVSKKWSAAPAINIRVKEMVE